MTFVGAIHFLVAPISRGPHMKDTSLRLVLLATLASTFAGCATTPDLPVAEEAPAPVAPTAAAPAPAAASTVTPAGELAAAALANAAPLVAPVGMAPAPQGQDPLAPATPVAPGAPAATLPPADGTVTPPVVEAAPAETPATDPGKELAPTGPTKDHGGWVAPEVLAAEQGVRGTTAEPGKVYFVTGRAAPYCRSVWRHRFEYSGYERYVEINGFTSDAESKDCATKYKTANKPNWDRVSANQHLVGKYFVIVSDPLLAEKEKWEPVRAWLEKNQPKKTSRIPKGVLPAGLVPGQNWQADKGLPPPKGIKIRSGVKKYTPRGADVAPATGPAPIPPPPAGTPVPAPTK